MSKQIQVIVIDPRNKTVEARTISDDFNAMKADVIGCSYAEVISMGGPDDGSANLLAWIDDSGLQGDWKQVGFTEVFGYPTPLAGVIVFTGDTDESEEGGGAMTSAPAWFTLEAAKRCTRFVEPETVRVPGVKFTTFDDTTGQPTTTHVGPEVLTFDNH